MRKSFLFNVFFMVFVNFLIKPFWVFGIDRTVQNQLGEADYGLYFAIFNFTYLFQILLDFGFQNYNNREVAADNSKIDELLPTIFSFKMMLLVVYLILCIAIAYPLGYLSKPFIWIILVNQILLSFNIYLRSNISAHQQFIKDALLSVLDKTLMIVFCGILIWSNISALKLTIFNFALAQLLAYFITFLVCLFFSLRLTDKLVFKFNFLQFKTIATETLPYALIHFLMTTYYRIDGVMLEKLQGTNGAYETGIYAQGYRIMESLNNIGYLLASILLPLFAYKIVNKQDVKPILKSGFNIIFCITVSVIVCLFYYRFEIMDLLYKSTDTVYASDVFGYLLLNFFPVGLLYVIGTLLTANKNFKTMIYTLVFAVLLNIALNFYLIKNFGAKGAGQATLITQIFMLICYSVYSFSIFNIKLNFKYIAQLLAFVGLCLFDIYIIPKEVVSSTETKTFLLQLVVYFIFVPFNIYITGLITMDTLKLKVGVAE
ncbi:MAG: oligosaccharide flippase family protein [Saprospirales bacterium]|nr:oligosaccharide flippase family protein [Saprospirales bacterium]